jgi:hypothetical protein
MNGNAVVGSLLGMDILGGNGVLFDEINRERKEGG